jgi:Mce-associated membrane protein
MQEPEPRDQPQPRTRNRLTGDVQTPRRPRPVAGQRAAAKRARQPERGDEQAASGLAANSTATTATAVATLAEPPENVEAEPRAESRSAANRARTSESESEAEHESGLESAADAAATESKPRKTTAHPRRLRIPGPRRAVVTAVLAVGVVAVLAVATILGIQYRDAQRTDQARAAAVAAAEKAAPVIFSYDYRHLDQDFAKAEALLTGTFRDQYAKTTQTVVKPTALQYQGVVKAVVAKPSDGGAPAVSVVSASPDQVVILAFIDQSTTSTRVTGTKVDQNRVLLTLTDTPQGWLVSAVNAL